MCLARILVPVVELASNFVCGISVPIPTLPVAAKRIISLDGVWNTASPIDEYTAAPPTLCKYISALLSVSFKTIFGELLVTSNKEPGIAVPSPTFPVSSIVTTCDAPSYNLRMSAVPLCVTATPTMVLLSAPTSTRSTPIKFVSSVVVVPSTVKLLLTLKS